ncbi:MAG: hypothetical protein RBQ79_08370, partial [Sphaerochaetaceae bacterium]|nr:hypothetical protein [Sphaerochaetaceae bacterium]
MTKEQLKQKVCEVIEQNAEKIIAIGRDVYAHPELGFKEYRTAKIFSDTLRSLQLECREEIAITGVKAVGHGRTADASVMLLGELDAVISPQHPFADKQTGAAHSCGHH